MATEHLDATTRLVDTAEVVDALYRFAAGQDLGDRELFRSAFAPHATLDFTQPARRFGGDVPVMDGRETIEGILDVVGPLATTHTVTNPRTTLDGDRATLQALVEAQHVDRADPTRHLLLKNIYDVTAVRDGRRFVIESMIIRTVWSDGDPTVLFGTTVQPAIAPIALSAASWIDTGDGTSLAPLRVHGAGAGTAFLRFVAGGRSGAHRHPAGEDLYVISGRLRVGDLELTAGDFLHTPPGGVHDAEAYEPTVVLISVPEPIELV